MLGPRYEYEYEYNVKNLTVQIRVRRTGKPYIRLSFSMSDTSRGWADHSREMY